MVTTNIGHGGNFYVYTDDPAAPWSEPIWVKQGGIDPSLCFDDDHVYFTSNGDGPETGIYQCEIDIHSGAQLTETRYIWSGTGGRYPEAPHLYHIGDFYYLMIAEGGTEYGHMVTLARSESPWGPFVSCPHNPILTHRDQGQHPIQGTGHADLFQAHDGSWWLVFLAFRPQDRLFHHLGRETYLAPVQWTADGWPLVGQNKVIYERMQATVLPQRSWDKDPERDDFAAPELRFCWNFLRNPYAGDWSLVERPGWLRLYGSPINLDAQDSPALIGRRQQHFTCHVSTLLDFAPQHDNHEAGLTALANNLHHYEIAVTRSNSERMIIVRRRIGDLVAIVAQERLLAGPVLLMIDAEPDKYTFSYAYPEQQPRPLATGATRYLSSEVAGGFTGVYFGMYATSNNNGRTNPADFDWFVYHAENPTPERP
jgi:alpha-N-arabinofuranosidase